MTDPLTAAWRDWHSGAHSDQDDDDEDLTPDVIHPFFRAGFSLGERHPGGCVTQAWGEYRDEWMPIDVMPAFVAGFDRGASLAMTREIQ